MGVGSLYWGRRPVGGRKDAMHDTPDPLDTTAIPDAVREFYTRHPFPPLDATREPLLADLHYTRSVLWPDRLSLAGLRILDAGCGTGEIAVRMAREFPEVQVTGIDVSAAAIAVAATRAREAGVEGNLHLREVRLEDLEPGEPFDLVVSSGVIHHLVDPATGLRALARHLAPTGGMSLMVYGTYGRHAVLLLRRLMDRLGEGREEPERVARARTLIAALPPRHPFQAGEWEEVAWARDTGIADLLMHVYERSFTVPELRRLLTDAGLRLERFADTAAYQPEHYLTTPEGRGLVAGLPESERAEVAELLHGRMARHRCFVTLAGRRPLRYPVHGSLLAHMRPRRMRWFDWSHLDEDPASGDLPVPDWAVPDRVLTLPGWSRRFFPLATGERTALQLFHDPELRAVIPGGTSDEQFAAYSACLEQVAREELVLFEP